MSKIKVVKKKDRKARDVGDLNIRVVAQERGEYVIARRAKTMKFRVFHGTYNQAVQEARRLCQQSRAQFYVLNHVATVEIDR